MQDFTLTGRLGQSPELRKVGDTDVCEFTVASKRYAGKQKGQITEWFDVAIWGATAEMASKMLQTGSSIMVKGPIQPRAYLAKDGTAVAKIKVNAKDWEGLGNLVPKSSGSQSGNAATESMPNPDDIPF